jgi:DNA-binding MarR family transcriptional regulator
MRIIMANDFDRPGDETLILQAVLRLARQMRQAAQDGELTGSALALLASLHRDGAMSAVELARHEGLQPQSLSRLLARLDRLGLLQRSIDPADARRHVIAITVQGTAALMRQMVRRRDWLADRMAERLNSEEKTVLLDAAQLMLRMAI